MSANKITDALVRVANEAQQDFFDEHKMSEFFSSGHYTEESMRAALEAISPDLELYMVPVGYRWRHSASEKWQFSEQPCGWEYEAVYARVKGESQ